MNPCKCPRVDGYVLHRQACGNRSARRTPAPTPDPVRDPEADDLACAWADYRKDYGISVPHMTAAYLAFRAGWKAARQGDQSGVLR